MTDTAKREPSIEAPAERPSSSFPPASSIPTQPSTAVPTPPLSERGGLDQLSRIEEKSARIEEKFARTEALLMRVESTFQDAMTKFGGIARTSDVHALESRIRRLPGLGTISFVALIAALIGALAVLVLLKYGIAGFLPSR
jgi:hypothetical protein